MNGTGLPHSDTSGSKLAYSSPKIFAVNHVLHRHLVPRHPPCAVASLILYLHYHTHIYYLIIIMNKTKLIQGQSQRP